MADYATWYGRQCRLGIQCLSYSVPYKTVKIDSKQQIRFLFEKIETTESVAEMQAESFQEKL